jgi:uncharacterized membrane protein
MVDAELQQTLEQFEFRLIHLEELLGVHKRPVVRARPVARKPVAAIPFVELESGEELDDATIDSETPPPLPVMSYRSQAPAEPISQPGLEQTIGLKWAGWVGAVVLVIGAGLGIKFGYDQGWFGIVSPAARLVCFALAGFGLISAGEWVYRRINTISAAGLFGAGIAVLFVVSFSGYAHYDLYPRDTAFIFMGLSTVIGALVARRADMVSIAVLSLIGGNLAPVLLASASSELTGFLSYVLMLQAVALILAAWGAAPKWWALRGLSLATTSIWILSLINHSDHTTLIPFTFAFAGLYQLEILISAHRSRLTTPYAGSTFSMLVTAGLTAVMLYWLKDSTQVDRLVFLLGIAGITGFAAVACKRAGKTIAGYAELAVGYAIQSVAVIVIAVPVAFSGIWISFAWAVLAVAFAVLGRVLDKPMARYAGPLVWLLAVGELYMWATGFGELHHVYPLAISILGQQFYQHTLMYFGLALVGQIIAKLAIGEHSDEKHIGLSLSVIGSGIWVMASMDGLAPLVATSFVLIYSFILIALDLLDQDLNFSLQASVLIALAAAKWAIVDLFMHRIFKLPVVEPIVLSARGVASALLLIDLTLMYIRAKNTLESNPFSRQILPLVKVVAVVAVFWMGTFGIDQQFINLRSSPAAIFADPNRAEQVAISIYWSFFALASITAGFGWRTAGLRYFGLTLFAVTLLKVVSIDLSQVSTGYRILSFMGLGVLLLGTSVIYGKVSPILLAETNMESDTL